MLAARTREQTLIELIELLRGFREDYDQSLDITPATGIFRELGFESIDVIGLSTALEAHFDQPFPFPEFMMVMRQRKPADITVGDLHQFLMANMRAGA